MEEQKIIVRMPNWIGDLVMATPILADLRAHFPKAEITAMCRRPLSALLEKDPNVDELFSFSKSVGSIRRNEKRNVIEKLVKGRYDIGVILPNSLSSAWLFAQGSVKRRIGFKGNFRRLLLTDPLPFPKERKAQHLTLTYKALLKPLGIPISQTPPALFVASEEVAHAWEVLGRFGVDKGIPLVGINPGAAYGSAKCWLPERFREVTEKILETDKDLNILYFGDKSHESLIKEICQGLPGRVINLAGVTNLRELMALTSLCRIFLTNDSGPMHIADALSTPLVALFGSTDEVVTGPYSQAKGVIHKHVACSPCFRRTCPIDFRCMKGIESDEVCQKIAALFEGSYVEKI